MTRASIMLRFVLALAVAVLAAAPASRAEEWGDLTGKFTYDGTPPEPAKLVVTADKEAFEKLGLVDESLVVDKDTKGVANIAIYVWTKDVKIHPDLEESAKKSPTLRFDNKGARFVPRVLSVWLGKQSLCLCNSDPVPHNTNIQPFGDTPLNPLLPPKAEVDHKFAQEQRAPIPVKCNIHPWMTGHILPRNNPYVAVTAKDGTFKLEKLPAGVELEFKVWHERRGYLKAKDWKLGQFKMTLKPGKNDLGEVKCKPELFEK